MSYFVTEILRGKNYAPSNALLRFVKKHKHSVRVKISTLKFYGLRVHKTLALARPCDEFVYGVA